jgi:hypothetical protein
MSVRLQVLFDERELDAIRRVAVEEGMTVSEWVRATLRKARQERPSGDAARKLAVIRAAAGHDFPTGDIDQMLTEIETGYVQ